VSIRWRLALSGVVVAGLALLLFGVLLDRIAASAAPTDQKRSLTALAERTAAAVRAAAASALVPAVPLVVDDPAEGTEAFAAVLDDAGRVLFTDGDLSAVLPALPAAAVRRARKEGSAEETVTLPSGTALHLSVVRWERPDLDLSGVVLAGQPTRYAAEQFRDLRVLLIVSGVVALLSAAIATWVVSGRVLRPLRRLAETADEIGRTGDLSRRLPPARSRDVLGSLTGSFNGMLERLDESRSRLAENLASQRAFLADVSHELRSPLTTIRSNAGFLRERTDATPADRAEALDDMAAEAERMSRLVDGLLTLARADAGEAFAREPVRVASVLTGVERRARALGRTVRTHVSGDPTVLGDADALGRLLWILVDNGLAHGGDDVDVAIVVRDGTVEIAVGDRGPGIPADELEVVFERFRRGSTREGAGAGLGLAIARHLAEAHGGAVRAEPRPGGGALVVVELPSA